MSDEVIAGVEVPRRALRELARAGSCARPIRIAAIREGAPEADRIILVACKDRRAALCPACAHTYKGDAWQVVASGMRGGKGVPIGVRLRPRVFVTLTAPSFGAVHSGGEHNGGRRVCHQGRTIPCRHGVTPRCGERHAEDDPLLGQPLCVYCFDYEGAILWNALVSKLWHRTSTRLTRQLERMGPVNGGGLRLSYVRAAEFQRRGLVHLHVVLRVDGPDGIDSPPPSWVTTGHLATALQAVVPQVTTAVPVTDSGGRVAIGWGHQMAVIELAAGDPEDDRQLAVAAYVAKYATKTADATGELAYRIHRASEIRRLPVNAHQRRLVETAWRLGGRSELADIRLRRCAHAFGYRGHVVTKSVTYSTTFSALRAVRADYQRSHGEVLDEEGPELHYGFAGRGYDDPGLGELAYQLASLATAHGKQSAESRSDG